MANPFKETLDEIIDYAVKKPPEYKHLYNMSGFLSHQEDKVYALERGLSFSLMKHYESCINDTKYDDTRVIIVQMLESLITIMKGRLILLNEIGINKALAILKDPCPRVRQAACHMFSCLVGFVDSHEEVLKGRVVIIALTDVFMNDEKEVSLETVPGLTVLSEFDPGMQRDTMMKVAGLLSNEDEIHKVSLCKQALQLLWNVCCCLIEKETAIDCGVTETVGDLLASQNPHIRRLATGCLMAISVAERGKEKLIANGSVLRNLCSIALNMETLGDLRQNAILTIRNVVENPEGLLACGKHLVKECEILVEILAPDQIARVVHSLLDVPAFYKYALDSLNLLVKSAVGRKAAWNILEIVPRLHNMSFKGSNQRTKGLARRCLETLCTDNPDAQAELDKLKPLGEAQDDDDEGKDSMLLAASETAIVLVQFQNDYIKKSGVLHHFVAESMEESQVLWNTVDLVESARRKGALIVHTPFVFQPSDSNPSYQFGHMKLIAEYKAFAANSWGAQVVEELAPEIDNIILDNMHTLNAFENTDLDTLLRNKGIVNVAFCGLTSDTSLSATMRDAYERGFNVLTVVDCTAATSKDAQVQSEHCAFPMFSEVLTRSNFLASME